MDYTPESEDYGDSGRVSPSFDASSRVFESTPKIETDSTPHLPTNNPKKRKAQYCDIPNRKLNDLLHSCPSTPQASSTLNESLTREFENFKIEQHFFDIGDCDEPTPKFLKNNGCEKIVTPPSTPEAHHKTFSCTPKKLSSFQTCSSACIVPSPLKEQHEILYPTLKPLDPLRKPLTPQKFKEKLEKIGQNSTPFKKSLFESSDNKLFSNILSNNIIMGEILEYLSNGDLFRVSMVSKGFRDALDRNKKASQRYHIYKESHKNNKENYKITPPSSPESQCLFPDGSVSPNSRHFVDFIEMGSILAQNQSLTKCRRCGKPSVVEKSIAQCQEVSCGYIFCQKCDSFSYIPEDFFDTCRGLTLGGTKRRRKLEDLSNCSPDFNFSSILSSTSENYHHSSGYFSGYESSHTPASVKRDLSKSFGADESLTKPKKALFDSNRSLRNAQVAITPKREDKRRIVGNVAPVVQSEAVKKIIEIIEPPSPPKVKVYAACSKQSKRNLKRLTR